MKLEQFVKQRQSNWNRFQNLVRAKHPSPEEKKLFPEMFREICRDLNLAKERSYGEACIGQLNDLAVAGYHKLYNKKESTLSQVTAFALVGFPQILRAEAKLFWLCAFLFFVPFGVLIACSEAAPEWIDAVISADVASNLESMYGDGRELGRDGSGADDATMFMFYIYNNVSIDFATFAGGIVFGLGSLFFMIYNGIYLGACTALIHRMGFHDNFYSFTSGHSSFELTALVISGMAGLKLAQGIVAPGQRRRLHALQHNGKVAIQLLCGAAAMTFMAAIIEGFWSPRPLPLNVKYTVGISLWVLLGCYFLFAGRRKGRQHNRNLSDVVQQLGSTEAQR